MWDMEKAIEVTVRNLLREGIGINKILAVAGFPNEKIMGLHD